MTPKKKKGLYKDGDRGTFLIDRRIKDVGRIKRASGTTIPSVLRDLNQMLDGLAARGRQDVLVAIRDGQLSPLMVYSHYRGGNLDKLPRPEALVPLYDTWEEWNKHRACGVHDRAAKTKALGYLRQEGRKDATVNDLPTLVARLRIRFEQEKHAVSFNHTKRAVQAFLRDRYTNAHPLYADVRSYKDLTVIPKQHKAWLTVQGVLALCNTLDDECRSVVWSLCASGMRPKEYFNTPWERRTYCIHVPFGKTRAAARDIPDLGMCASPPMSYGAFMQRLRRRSSNRPYDFRRTFMTWMEDAEIDPRRRLVYFGHEVPQVTELYRQKPTLEQLRNDAEKMTGWLTKQREAALKLVQEAK
jgi:integrase